MHSPVRPPRNSCWVCVCLKCVCYCRIAEKVAEYLHTQDVVRVEQLKHLNVLWAIATSEEERDEILRRYTVLEVRRPPWEGLCA